MSKFAHSMIRVLDDEVSIAFYKEAFGLEIADQFDFPTFRLTYLKSEAGDFELELTLNKGREEPYDLGDGYGHLAIVVEDLESQKAQLETMDIETGKIIDFAPDGRLLARFFLVKDPDAYQLEVIERGGRFQ